MEYWSPAPARSPSDLLHAMKVSEMQNGDVIEQALTLLVAAGIAELQSIQGCSEAAVDRIETIHDGSLPAIYRQFLLCMGRSAGKFLVGSDYSAASFGDCAHVPRIY
jgi:hypothetical protein